MTSDKLHAPLTITQIRLLFRIKKEGSVLASEIPTVTLQSMLPKGHIEECGRSYFGPRELRYRLSAKGLALLEDAKRTVEEDPEPQPCTVPPRGWRCTRGAGHDGPCAAWPITAETLKATIASIDHSKCDEECSLGCEAGARDPMMTRVMDLNEAIEHATEKGQGSDPCAANHRLLAGWLTELKTLREVGSERQWLLDEIDGAREVLAQIEGHADKPWQLLEIYNLARTRKLSLESVLRVAGVEKKS